MPAFWAAAEIRRQRDFFSFLLFLLFFFVKFTHYIPASGAHPPNITFIANGTFAVQRVACGSAACPKGWPNQERRIAMKVPINKDSPLAMDDFDAAVQQRMERLQSYIDLIRTAEAVEEEVKVKGTKLYLGPEDVAAYLNCSIPTARQYMHRPGFPLIQLGENGTKLAVFAPAFHAYNAGKY
jgi:hypothetical protein